MPVVESNGAQIWYDVQGEGEPIVCIGGMGLVSNQFDFVTPLLARQAQVINWDLRGVGKSAPAPLVNYDDYADQADDLLAVMDAAGIEKAHIWAAACSHIGVRFAAKYPERTASLIIFPWYSPKKAISHIFDAGVELSLAFNSLEYWAKVIATKFTTENYKAKMVDWEVPKLLGNLSPEMFRIHWGSMKASDRTCDLPLVQSDVLLLMGDAGVAGSEANRREIDKVSKAVKGEVEAKLIPESGGTYFMIERPEETVAALMDWMGRHPAR